MEKDIDFLKQNSQEETNAKRIKPQPPFRFRYMALIAIACGAATFASVYLDLLQSLVVFVALILLILFYNIRYNVNWDAIAIFALISVCFYIYAEGTLINAESKVNYEGTVQGTIERTTITDNGTTVIIASQINGQNEKIAVYEA